MYVSIVLLCSLKTECISLSCVSGWLGPEDDPLGYVSRIDQRIDDVTGLEMATAEQLQVCIWVTVV